MLTDPASPRAVTLLVPFRCTRLKRKTTKNEKQKETEVNLPDFPALGPPSTATLMRLLLLVMITFSFWMKETTSPSVSLGVFLVSCGRMPAELLCRNSSSMNLHCSLVQDILAVNCTLFHGHSYSVYLCEKKASSGPPSKTLSSDGFSEVRCDTGTRFSNGLKECGGSTAKILPARRRFPSLLGKSGRRATCVESWPSMSCSLALF